MPDLQPPRGSSEESGDDDGQLYREEEDPTDRALVRFEREDLKFSVNLPGRYSGALLDTLRWAVAATLAVAGPSLTLNALPADFPAWMTFTVVMTQLAVTAVVVFVFGRRDGKPRRN